MYSTTADLLPGRAGGDRPRGPGHPRLRPGPAAAPGAGRRDGRALRRRRRPGPRLLRPARPDRRALRRRPVRPARVAGCTAPATSCRYRRATACCDYLGRGDYQVKLRGYPDRTRRDRGAAGGPPRRRRWRRRAVRGEGAERRLAAYVVGAGTDTAPRTARTTQPPPSPRPPRTSCAPSRPTAPRLHGPGDLRPPAGAAAEPLRQDRPGAGLPEPSAQRPRLTASRTPPRAPPPSGAWPRSGSGCWPWTGSACTTTSSIWAATRYVCWPCCRPCRSSRTCRELTLSTCSAIPTVAASRPTCDSTDRRGPAPRGGGQARHRPPGGPAELRSRKRHDAIDSEEAAPQD